MMEYRLDASLTRGFAAEFHGMEVHEIQDVIHVHILQVSHERVGSRFRTLTGDDDMLLVMFYGEVVNQQVLLTIDNV